MKRTEEEARRWLKQAEYDLEAARRNRDEKIYSYACFISEQAAQKALKAFLTFHGERYVWEHSVRKLAEKCTRYDSRLQKFVKYGATFDRFYLATRYPDAIAAPATPYESYTRKDAAEAVKLAGEIVAAVKAAVAATESDVS